MDLLSDDRLMVECSKGSLPAFELLVRRWDKRMINYFYRCTGQREIAEDLRQELFLRIYRQRRTYKSEGHFQSWLYRIAANLVIDKVARKRRPAMQSIDESMEKNGLTPLFLSVEDSTRRTVSAGEIQERILQALNCIPGDQRVALVMRHFENLTFREISEALQTSESAVKSRVYRGLDSLRKSLKQMGIFEADCFLTA